MNYNTSTYSYFSTDNDLCAYYKLQYPNFPVEVKHRTILPTGKISPVKTWMIDSAYDLLN